MRKMLLLIPQSAFFSSNLALVPPRYMYSVDEVDDDEVPSALSLDDYDAEGEGGWVLLEPVAGEAGEE